MYIVCPHGYGMESCRSQLDFRLTSKNFFFSLFFSFSLLVHSIIITAHDVIL